MNFKRALIGVGTAAGAATFALAYKKTRGVPRYLVGVTGMEILRRMAVAGWKQGSDQSRQRDVVDFNSEQSFPASDPPGWTAG